MKHLSLGRAAACLLLAASPLLAVAHGISEADRQRMLDGSYLQYVGLGASHMLTGYDHLLFLLGVVFLLSTFKDVAKFVTVFTIGHCITLIFATYFKITWNYYFNRRHHRAERDVQGVLTTTVASRNIWI